MGAFYLFCFIASTFISSAALSVLLAIRSFYRFLFPLPANKCCDSTAVRFYEGRVRHSRTKPLFNSFDYPVRYALFDLDRAHRAQHDSHLSADRAREIAGTDGPVFLLAIPTSLGYEQNPLKVYYCYDLGEEGDEERRSLPRLKNCIAEVTNTPWGEKVFFEFTPGSDMVAKSLHVSPFMDMSGNWKIRANEPGDNLFISVSVQHPTLGNFFIATLTAKSVPPSTTSLGMEMYFWLVPHKVIASIYWQSVKLWWRNAPFNGHPRYSNPSYRDDALSRGNEMCPFRMNKRQKNQPNEDSNGESRRRLCIWRDAEWPWA